MLVNAQIMLRIAVLRWLGNAPVIDGAKVDAYFLRQVAAPPGAGREPHPDPGARGGARCAGSQCTRRRALPAARRCAAAA